MLWHRDNNILSLTERMDVMSQVLENIKTRRSVRSYQDAQIPREQLEQILTAGLYAPSAKNSQLCQFTVVQGKEKLEALRDAIAKAIHNPDYHHFYNAPTLVIVSAPKDYPLAVPDCAVALENMFLAAHDLKLGSVWINQLGGICDQPEIRSILTKYGVPESHNVYGCAAIGYPAVEVAPDRENRDKVVFA